MKKYLIRIIFLSLLVFSSFVSAETKTFVKEYSYQASEADSKLSSRVIALEQVKRLLLEELGTYLESETQVKHFQLTKDQIMILTAGIVSTEIIEEKWDGKTYSLKAKIAADPKDVYDSIDKLRQDRQKTKELEEMRKKADEALREVEKLRKELEIAKVETRDSGQYNDAVNRLSATDWFEKGYSLGIAGRNKETVEAYTKAIELNPKYAEAYNNRGVAYEKLGDYRQAIKDYDKAIELDPKDAVAYTCRGTAYAQLGEYRQAIKDYNRAIELNPKFAYAYNNRGVAYEKLGNNQRAFEDYKIAAQLGNKEAQDYLRSKGISW